MFELILLFIIVVLIFAAEIGFDKPKDICKTHSWSKDISTNDLVCLECNMRLK